MNAKKPNSLDGSEQVPNFSMFRINVKNLWLLVITLAMYQKLFFLFHRIFCNPDQSL